MMPDFVIIGAQKAASTYVQLSLRDHPQVYLPYSETPFFQDPDYDPDRLDILESYFEDADLSDVRQLGIKRPDYLGRAECPKRIHRHIPDAKLIVVLRDPVQRLVSAYYHYVKTGFIPPVHVNEGVPKILSGEWDKKYPRSVEIIEYGMYYKHLKRYLNFFEKRQIKVIMYERLKNKNIETVQNIYNYLGVDASYIPSSSNKRPKSSVYDLSRLKRIRSANMSINKYYRCGTRMKRIPLNKNIISYLKYAFLKGINYIDMLTKKRDKKPELKKSLKEKVKDEYQEDIYSLEDLLKTSLDHWK